MIVNVKTVLCLSVGKISLLLQVTGSSHHLIVVVHYLPTLREYCYFLEWKYISPYDPYLYTSAVLLFKILIIYKDS